MLNSPNASLRRLRKHFAQVQDQRWRRVCHARSVGCRHIGAHRRVPPSHERLVVPPLCALCINLLFGRCAACMNSRTLDICYVGFFVVSHVYWILDRSSTAMQCMSSIYAPLSYALSAYSVCGEVGVLGETKREFETPSGRFRTFRSPSIPQCQSLPIYPLDHLKWKTLSGPRRPPDSGDRRADVLVYPHPTPKE